MSDVLYKENIWVTLINYICIFKVLMHKLEILQNALNNVI